MVLCTPIYVHSMHSNPFLQTTVIWLFSTAFCKQTLWATSKCRECFVIASLKWVCEFSLSGFYLTDWYKHTCTLVCSENFLCSFQNHDQRHTLGACGDCFKPMRDKGGGLRAMWIFLPFINYLFLIFELFVFANFNCFLEDWERCFYQFFLGA